jgi:hypothetical protein
MYASVSFRDPEFAAKCVERYQREGFCVVQDVFEANECTDWFESILKFFASLGSGIDLANLEETWISENLPPQTRAGLYQALCGNIQAVWDIRSHPNVQAIFKTLYSHFRGQEIKDFIVSGDGVNLFPNKLPSRPVPDWAHLDQTTRNNTYQCIQGQAVLSNTTACFRASPGSHLVFDELMKIENVSESDTSNWRMITNVAQCKKVVEASGGQWQVPVMAPRGSFIVWSSTTVHSARASVRVEQPTNDASGVIANPRLGWRAVVYVCYRPREEFTDAQIAKRASVVKDNRTTNHWGTKIFAKRPGATFRLKFHPKIEEYLQTPSQVYQFSALKLSHEQQRLAGIV